MAVYGYGVFGLILFPLQFQGNPSPWKGVEQQSTHQLQTKPTQTPLQLQNQRWVRRNVLWIELKLLIQTLS